MNAPAGRCPRLDADAVEDFGSGFHRWDYGIAWAADAVGGTEGFARRRLWATLGGGGCAMAGKTMRAEDLRWVVCPMCHGALVLEGEGIRCAECGRQYPVVDGIPVLLSERAN